MEARVQADRQSTGTRDTLLVIDQESGLPIEGAYILTRERLLVSSPRGMIVFGHGTCFMDTVLVQCLGYGSRRVPLNEVFKESSIHTVCLSPDIQKLGEVVVTGERAGASPNVVSRRLSSPEIRNALGTSLATLLERVSGVSSISTGTTVSKPVIQGMYGNRILIIHNGARQTGQQWGSRPRSRSGHERQLLCFGNQGLRCGKIRFGCPWRDYRHGAVSASFQKTLPSRGNLRTLRK